MSTFNKDFRRCFSKGLLLTITTFALLNFSGCSHGNASEALLPYVLASGQAQQLTHGYYKCRYAHYRDGIPVSGSEDILKVPTGTLISYGGYEHIIIEGEVFDANVWFEARNRN